MDDQPTVSFDGATVIEWDEETSTYRLQHNWQAPVPISLLVVEVVAAVTGREATELEPLYGTVDPELIDGLVVSSWRSDVTLSFPYEGHTVTITSTGSVGVTDQERTET
jgi:hypothetical protein